MIETLLLIGGGIFLLNQLTKNSQNTPPVQTGYSQGNSQIVPVTTVTQPAPSSYTQEIVAKPEESYILGMQISQPTTPAPSVDATVNPNATVVGSSDVSGNEISFAALYGNNVYPYPKEAVETGQTFYTNGQQINQYVRSGYWDKSVLDHVFYWSTFWMKVRMGLVPSYQWERWVGDPIQNLKVLTGFDSYDTWEQTFKAQLYYEIQ